MPPAHQPLKVVFYSSCFQLEPVLSLAREMHRHLHFHVLLEMAPEAWSSALFDVPPQRLPGGVTDGDAALRDCVPASIRACWQQAKSFDLVVHDFPKALHPRTWSTSLRAARFIRALRPDVLHLDNYSLRLAPLLWFLRHIPMVLTLHDPEPHSGEGDWRIELARRLTFPRVDRFLLLNAAGKPQFAARFGVEAGRIDSAHLGPHGLCKEWMQETPPEDERTVLFFGRLSPYKGLPVFYAAAELVARRLGAVRFVVAGRPRPDYTPPPPPVLANGSRVEVLDRYLHNRETAELFARATVVACPYVDATQSGVVLTAFAFGKAVVATRVGGLPEYVEDGVTGLLVEPGDASGLADALVRLLEDAELRRRLRAAIELRAHSQLSWAATAESLVQCYRRAIGEPTQTEPAAVPAITPS